MRHQWLPYLVLTIAFSVGLIAVTHRQDAHIRHDINVYAAKQCKETTINTITLFNDFVRTNIQVQQDALQTNIAQGEKQRARNNLKAILKFRDSFLPVPSPADCDVPILK